MTQLYYEDVQVGMELPTLLKHPTTRQLVKWAGACHDYHELHYDKDVAEKSGLPSVILQGPLTLAFLGQLVTDWMGEQGTLKKLGCQWRGINFPGEDLICKGVVTKKYEEVGEQLVECGFAAALYAREQLFVSRQYQDPSLLTTPQDSNRFKQFYTACTTL